MKQGRCKAMLMVCVGLGLTACARVADSSLQLFSTTVPAIAMVQGQLLQGEAQLAPDRTGTVTLAGDADASEPLAGASPVARCVGRLRYTSTAAGIIDLRCSTGVAAELRFTLLSETRGYAYGESAGGPVSLALGLSPQEARAFLSVPANKQLLERPETHTLELR